MIKKKLLQVLSFLGVVLVPILVLLLTYRRESSVALAFASYILGVYRWHFLFMAILAIFVAWSLWHYPAIRFFLRSSRYVIARYGVIVVILLGCSLLSLWKLMGIEYRIFSEVWYQERALQKLRSDDVLGARLICERYVQLFPQRKSDGGMPDPVCVPLHKFTASMASLKEYIDGQHPTASVIDGMGVGVGWVTRRKALVTLEHLAGGASGNRETADLRKKNSGR